MTLQASGAISLANVQSEFGGAAPTSITEYYGAASGVPSSGTISLSHFWGKSNIPTGNLVTGSTTVGGGGDTIYGLYADATWGGGVTFGSLVPMLTVNGRTIAALFYTLGSVDLITIGNASQNLFTSMKIDGTTYYTSGVTGFNNSGGYANWSWLSSNVFGAVGSSHSVSFL